MYFATAEQMAYLDEIAVSDGLQIRQMMELAGWGMLQLFTRLEIPKDSRIAVIVGKGNKGGDGLSAARHLINYGFLVDIYLLEDDISTDSRHHLNLLIKMNANIIRYTDQNFGQYSILIDSLIGYRMTGKLREPYDKAVQNINSAGSMVVSYDIPTGIKASDKEPDQLSVKANYTLMLAMPKIAAQSIDSQQIFGDIYLADIGIPDYQYDQIAKQSRPNFEHDGLLKLTI